MESRITTLQAPRPFEETRFFTGTFFQTPQSRTAERYDQGGLGISLGFVQHIRAPWSAGLELRWGEWKKNTDAPWDAAPASPYAHPLCAFSRIEFAPQLHTWVGDSVGRFIRPFATAGVGGVTFTRQRALDLRRVPTDSGEVAATYGWGVHLNVWEKAGIKLSTERWRGVRSFAYSEVIYRFEVEFGDLDF